ncbi:unnamed protein product, partial [Effrenium voratum]
YLTIFQTLEPLFADYRKLRYRDMNGKMSIIRMDEFIDWLMREETICDVTMPQIPKRETLEQTGQLDRYQSVLEDDLEDLEELEQSLKEMQDKEEAQKRNKSKYGDDDDDDTQWRRERDKDDQDEKRDKKDKKERKAKDEDKKAKKIKYANKADEERAEGHSKKDKDGLTVDEWNEIRKGMGLKALK